MFSKSFYILSALFAATLFAQTGYGNPIINFETRYFEFDASTKPEVIRELRLNSPRHGANGRYALGLTEWSIHWQYDIRSQLFECRIVEFTPTVNIVIHLPYWVNKHNADTDLQRKWDDFVRTISDHEDVHKLYAIEAAKELKREAENLKPRKRCEQLKLDLKRLHTSVLNKYRAKNHIFDSYEKVFRDVATWF